MDSSIVCSLISLLSAIVIFALERLLPLKTKVPRKLDIKYLQLTQLFEPIKKILFLSSNADIISLAPKITQIVHCNLSLVPQELYDIVIKINQSNSINEEQCCELRRIVDDNYNYLCESLGFPCPSSTPKTKRLALLCDKIETNIHLFLIIVCVILTITFMIAHTIKELAVLATIIVSFIAALLFVVGILMLITE